MGARHKLNQAYLNGSLIVAAMVGFCFQSWLAFWIVLALGVALDLSGGQIRTNPKNINRRHDR
ncbi:MAG: hypothetical protein JNM18_00905 [Planctomycetaceae bacterium]|nr:hypothetical protein [Planctomycetaceae bacterium]